MNTQDLQYADRILNISVTGTVARIEWGVLQAPAKDGEPPTLVRSQTTVIPIDGFVNAFSLMDQTMKKLVGSGLLSVRKPDEAAKEEPKQAPKQTPALNS